MKKSFAFLAMLIPVYAKADDNVGKTLVTNMNYQVRDAAESGLTLLQIFLGVGAGIALVVIIVKLIKGDDREGASKLAWWIGGMVIAFILLGFVKQIISGQVGVN